MRKAFFQYHEIVNEISKNELYCTVDMQRILYIVMSYIQFVLKV